MPTLPSTPGPGPTVGSSNRRRNFFIVLGAVAALVIAGVAFGLADRGGNGLGAGYLSQGPNSIVFIQWTVNGTHVTGTAHEDDTTGICSNRINVGRATDKSHRSGSGVAKISLSFDGAASIFGTYSGSTFTIGIPQSDGTLQPAVKVHLAAASAFNNEVATLRNRVNIANQQAIAQQQAAAAAQKRRADEQAINSAAQTLTGALASLRKDVAGISTATAGLARALRQGKRGSCHGGFAGRLGRTAVGCNNMLAGYNCRKVGDNGRG